jgi:RND superfamily putative drug exporter
MLARLARACVRHRWIVIGAWVLILVVANGIAGGTGSGFSTEFAPPDGESGDVIDQLEAADPTLGGLSSQIVFRAEQGIDDPEVRAAIEPILEFAEEQPGIDVTSPWDQPQQISQTEPIAYAQLDIENINFEDAVALGTDIRDFGDAQPDVEGLTIEYGGDIFAEFEFPASEVYGVLAAVIILIVAFGSVLAMGLPIGTALFGIGIGFALVTLLSHTITMPDFTAQNMAMIALGVGIDYALFIVTRYREAIHAGVEVEEAVVEALDTSGRAVLFAGLTVIISLLGLTAIGLPFVTGIAVGMAAGVLVMIVAALTLLPALLGWIGTRIDNTSRAALIAVAVMVVGVFLGVTFEAPGIVLGGLVLSLAFFALSFFVGGMKRFRQLVPHRVEPPREKRFWYRWSRFIQRRPWVGAVGAAVVLVTLAIPLFSIRLGFGDYGNLPERQTARRAYDLVAEGFGPGTNGQIFVTVPADVATDQPRFDAFAAELDDAPGTARVINTTVLQKDADGNETDEVALGLVILYPDTSPQDKETARLVQHLRDDVIPASGVAALVGGGTAVAADFSAYLGERTPYLFGAVLILSFLLLMVVFRSILVPLKAVVMNLLSVGAAYGILVAIFQWGWLSGLIGVDRSGPIEAWVPMFLFAVVFGLSMDYEVFLLSRIKEQYDITVRRGKPDNATAVADGVALTARVITAAALIMFCVFFAFVLGDDRQIKLFGLGLGMAVLIDATIVRLVLVPATMELLGDKNWWFPKWLDRIVPKVNVEGHYLDEEAARLEADRGGPPTTDDELDPDRDLEPTR